MVTGVGDLLGSLVSGGQIGALVGVVHGHLDGRVHAAETVLGTDGQVGIPCSTITIWSTIRST